MVYQHSPVGWPFRLLALGLIALAGVYAGSCVLTEMPTSPVQVRAARWVHPVIHPVFDQDWQLFAPNPASYNNRMLVTAVTYDGTSYTQQAPFDVEIPLEVMPRGDHFLPTKLPGISLAANEEWSTYRVRLETIDKLPKPEQAPATAQLNKDFAVQFDMLSRVASYFAERRFPGLRVSKERVTFTRTDIVPFSERFTATVEPEQQQLTTSWLPFRPVRG
jgi:hypothetical protein